MKNSMFILLTLYVGTIACSKDKPNTSPQIAIKSYNTKNVSQQWGDLVINLEFRDAEGDLGNGKFIYLIKRVNRRPLLPGIAYPDSIVSTIPEFPDNHEGEFQLRTQWVNLKRDDRQNDTIFFRFIAVDRAGNKSDTTNSDQVVILRQ